MRKTDYSLNIGGNKNLAAVVDITRDVNGLHLNFNARQAFDDSSDKNANVSLSKNFNMNKFSNFALGMAIGLTWMIAIISTGFLQCTF